MGAKTQRNVERIYGEIGVGQDAKVFSGPHLTIKEGRYQETADVIRATIEDQSRFILSVFGFGSAEEHWRMNVYEFYRDFVRAFKLNRSRQKSDKSE